MRRTLPILLIFLLILVPAVGVQAQDDITPQSLAVEWLAGQQADDGSFAADSASTAIAALALAVVGQPNEAAVAWLEESVSNEGAAPSTDVLSIALIAAAVNGADLSEWGFGAADVLARNLSEERGADIGSLCIGLVAMAHTGAELPPTAVNGLKAFQAEDGGFPLSAGEDSDVISTSVCIHTLQLAGESDALNAAVAFVADQQQETGGWGSLSEDSADALTTAFVLVGLNAAGEDLADWADATAFLESSQDRETGMVFGVGSAPSEESLDIAATGLAILVWNGYSFNPSEMMAEDAAASAGGGEFPEGPALDANWVVIGEGFEMPELDTADDFFVTVVDPFTNDELYGVQIINWTAEYQYTGFIVEQFLPGEVLLYLAEQDPSTWENISLATLQTLPPEELAKLPEDVQARAAE